LRLTGHEIWHAIWTAAALGLGLYGILALLLYLGQSRLLYMPTREIAVTPRAIGLQYEEVEFLARDGIRLSGWFVPVQNPRGALLFCHGNAGNISHRLDSLRIFHGLGLSTFIFDYRGYGRSQGRPSEQGTSLDAEAAWEYLVDEKGWKPEEIVVFGRSLGGAVAAWLGARRTPRALIVESCFTSVTDIASELYPFLPVRILSRFRYDTASALRDVHSPVLIIHSKNDEIIPYHHGCSLYAGANEPKHFLEIRGDHNTGFLMSLENYRRGLDSFLGASGRSETWPQGDS